VRLVRLMLSRHRLNSSSGSSSSSCRPTCNGQVVGSRYGTCAVGWKESGIKVRGCVWLVGDQ
jgi:hypothetical protein